MESFCIFFFFSIYIQFITIICWIFSMFFFTLKYVCIPNITCDILSWWPPLEGQPNYSKIQCLGIWGLELAKTEEKSCLVRNIRVFMQEVVVLYDICCWELSGPICCLGMKSWNFLPSIAYLLWDMLSSDSAAGQNLLYSFITVHESFSWNDFLRTSPVNVPTAAVPPFSPRDN